MKILLSDSFLAIQLMKLINLSGKDVLNIHYTNFITATTFLDNKLNFKRKNIKFINPSFTCKLLVTEYIRKIA